MAIIPGFVSEIPDTFLSLVPLSLSTCVSCDDPMADDQSELAAYTLIPLDQGRHFARSALQTAFDRSIHRREGPSVDPVSTWHY